MKAQLRFLTGLVLLAAAGLAAEAQQIGKFVPIAAGSDEDKALTEIGAATDPAQKLALIDKFSENLGKGDMAVVADEQYVNYYLAQKNYDKAFEYGDKLFAVDPDNFNNAVSMIRAANEKGDPDKLMAYGEKAGGILQRFHAAAPPSGTDQAVWDRTKANALEANNDNIRYVAESVYVTASRVPNPVKRAASLTSFAQWFPDSPYASKALVVAAGIYEQTQNGPKMLEIANGALTKDPNNIGMLLLVSDYYSDKGEQLDKAESSAKKAIELLAAAQKPEGVTDEQWQQQVSLQRGLALSALGQVNIQKKDNATAAENFKTAAPLLKQDASSYGRNQYRLGFALLNLKRNAEAKDAFTQAASVNSPYKALAEAKLKTFAATKKS
jgi:tetratricopeptide (TPR) repeat protein